MTSPRGLRSAIVRWSGLPLLLRETVQRKRTTILLYHDIAPEALDRQLSILGKRYNFITLRDYVGALRSGRTRSLPPKSMVVTFDDGHCGNYALLEVFRRHRVKPTIFICTGVVGTSRKLWTLAVEDGAEKKRLKRLPDEARLDALASVGFTETASFAERSALSSEEIDEMRDTVDFQPHTVFHAVLTRCSDERSRSEIVESKETLERDFGFDVYAFAFPNGDYAEREIENVRDAGYLCALTTELGLNGARADPFRLRRVCIPSATTDSAIIVAACPSIGQFKRLASTGRARRKAVRSPVSRTVRRRGSARTTLIECSVAYGFDYRRGRSWNSETT